MEMDGGLRAALERRYDGPIPPRASAPPDYRLPWREQFENRKHWSWQEVRRLGHLARGARLSFITTGRTGDRREWQRLRRNLAFALRSWAAYRDWLR